MSCIRFSCIRFAIVALLLGLFGSAEIATADEVTNPWRALRAGGHVALMRHADAPGGFGDPPGFRVEDCATQRNLSAKGRTDAEKIGARLKREGIAFETILSSPWCRCVDTAKLLDLGTVETDATFGNVVVLRDQREALTAGARARIAKWTSRGNLLIVTHGANILALTGVSPASGEMVIVKGGSDRTEPAGRLLLD
jgi:phosphohistidine phosphatase SixA